jgi:predicted dehydrogenase
MARAAHAAGSDELKIALVGCGGRGTGAASDCLSSSENIKLVAMADAFEDRLTGALGRLKPHFGEKIDVPPERQFVGLDAYKKAIDCGVDVVLLATPPGFRPMQYAAAIEAGKHVFMEKPCCTDAPGFRSLMKTNELADEKSLRVVVGLQRHAEPRYIETIKRIKDGAIGDLMFLRVYWNGSPVWTVKKKPEWTNMYYQIRDWYYFVWLCGDHIAEQHVHNIDIGNWVKGDHPVEAQGMGGRELRRDEDQGQIFDHHAVEFTFADGTKMFSQCRQMPGCAGRISEHAHGTKGTSNCAGLIQADQRWRYRGPGVNPYRQEHVNLINAIRNSEKLNEGWYGATSSMTAVLGRMATYSGKVVKWDDAVAKGPNEMPEKLAFDANPPVMPDPDGTYRSSIPVPGVYQPY